jgi:hypothetical protein
VILSVESFLEKNENILLERISPWRHSGAKKEKRFSGSRLVWPIEKGAFRLLTYLALGAVLIAAVYTVLFALEIKRQKNYPGFFAVMFLALAITGLPVYVLFFK